VVRAARSLAEYKLLDRGGGGESCGMFGRFAQLSLVEQ
jgi:hypothetical protein